MDIDCKKKESQAINVTIRMIDNSQHLALLNIGLNQRLADFLDSDAQQMLFFPIARKDDPSRICFINKNKILWMYPDDDVPRDDSLFAQTSYTPTKVTVKCIGKQTVIGKINTRGEDRISDALNEKTHYLKLFNANIQNKTNVTCFINLDHIVEVVPVADEQY